eukprot:1404978-Lingulodinium_polyedra.AAC.1
MAIVWSFEGHAMAIQWPVVGHSMAIPWPFKVHSMAIAQAESLLVCHGSRALCLGWPVHCGRNPQGLHSVLMLDGDAYMLVRMFRVVQGKGGGDLCAPGLVSGRGALPRACHVVRGAQGLFDDEL